MEKEMFDFAEGLAPYLFDRLPEYLPQMELILSRDGKKYNSRLHLDGTPSKTGNPKKSYVNKHTPSMIGDEDRSTSIYTLWENLNGRGWLDAVRAAAELVGVDMPAREETPEQRQRRETRERQASALCEMLNAAVYGLNERPDVADYLHGRGYNNEFIDIAQFGAKTPRFEELARRAGIATADDAHPLVIPLFSDGQLKGFQYRAILPDVMPKYFFVPGFKHSTLYGLEAKPTTTPKGYEVAIVEGVIDAMRAQAVGFDYVTASGSSTITDAQIQQLKRKGVEVVTLLPDWDGQHTTEAQKAKDADKIKSNADKLTAAGFRVYVARMQGKEGEKLDVDMFLKHNTAADFAALLDTSLTLKQWHVYELCSSYTRGKNTYKNLNELNAAVFSILAAMTPAELPTATKIYASVFGTTPALDVIREAVNEQAEKARQDAEGVKLGQYLNQAAERLKNDTNGAFEIYEQLRKQADRLELGDASRFADMDEPNQAARFINELRNDPPTIPLNWTLYDKKGTAAPIIATPGGITIFGSPTNHGKSTILINAALQLADNGADGCVLFYTFEQPAKLHFCKMLQTFARINSKTATEWITTGKPNPEYVTREQAEQVNADALRFSGLFDAGKLRILQQHADVNDLLQSLRHFAKTRKIKAVVIDYVQKMSDRESNATTRTGELSSVCNKLNAYVNETSTAIIAAAQLNRNDAKSPDVMDNNSIADSVAIEQTAAEIYLLWNTAKEPFNVKRDEWDRIAAALPFGFHFGEPGKLYVKHTKSRHDETGKTALLNINGSTGAITDGTPPPKITARKDPKQQHSWQNDNDKYFNTL